MLCVVAPQDTADISEVVPIAADYWPRSVRDRDGQRMELHSHHEAWSLILEVQITKVSEARETGPGELCHAGMTKT